MNKKQPKDRKIPLSVRVDKRLKEYLEYISNSSPYNQSDIVELSIINFVTSNQSFFKNIVADHDNMFKFMKALENRRRRKILTFINNENMSRVTFLTRVRMNVFKIVTAMSNQHGNLVKSEVVKYLKSELEVAKTYNDPDMLLDELNKYMNLAVKNINDLRGHVNDMTAITPKKHSVKYVTKRN